MNDKYIWINNYDRNKEFNEAAQKGKIRVGSDASYAYTQNSNVASAAWVTETISKKERRKGSGLIDAEKSSYGGEMYRIYIVLRFILEIWDESNNNLGKIRTRCNNLAGDLDSTQTKLKTKRSKTFRAILRAIKKDIAGLRKKN